MNRDINPQIWFSDRKLKSIPKHFLKSNTPASDEACVWVLSKLQGRFATDLGDSFDNDIYFEDPKELMIYELRWSGN